LPFSVVRGPSGSYVAEWLAGLIDGWGRWQDCVWLRAPGTQPLALAGPLLQACRYRWAGDDQHQPGAGPAGPRACGPAAGPTRGDRGAGAGGRDRARAGPPGRGRPHRRRRPGRAG